MLIEFTGPSAIGKSAFARHLLATLKDVHYVRKSMGIHDQRDPQLFSRLASQIHQLPVAFASALKWNKGAYSMEHDAASKSMKMALEFCVLRGCSRDSRLWLLDQGRLQLGSWLPPSVLACASEYATNFKRFLVIGDAVLSISMPPKLAEARLRLRGHKERGEEVARQRGFGSYKLLMEFEVDQVHQKIALARALGSQVVHYDMDADGVLQDRQVYLTVRSDQSESITKRILDIANAFEQWWNPSA